MRLRALLLMTTALMPFVAPAFAGPEGATVVGGQVSVQNPGSANVTVNQFSQNAIVNWHTFNIGTGERTQFVQPNSSSVILNRVTGALGPSQILGTLDANGKVFVVNRDGTVYVEMTLTTPSCPVAGALPGEVQQAVGAVDGVNDVRVKLVWSPPWTRDRMSEEAKLELGLL